MHAKTCHRHPNSQNNPLHIYLDGRTAWAIKDMIGQLTSSTTAWRRGLLQDEVADPFIRGSARPIWTRSRLCSGTTR